MAKPKADPTPARPRVSLRCPTVLNQTTLHSSLPPSLSLVTAVACFPAALLLPSPPPKPLPAACSGDHPSVPIIMPKTISFIHTSGSVCRPYWQVATNIYLSAVYKFLCLWWKYLSVYIYRCLYFFNACLQYPCFSVELFCFPPSLSVQCKESFSVLLLDTYPCGTASQLCDKWILKWIFFFECAGNTLKCCARGCAIWKGKSAVSQARYFLPSQPPSPRPAPTIHPFPKLTEEKLAKIFVSTWVQSCKSHAHLALTFRQHSHASTGKLLQFTKEQSRV